ncbi:MAG: hypothetical protein IM566_23330 [Pseudanabaena sp. M152S2SP2A07QC]|nr:hypothetical protein [Pseudanabaena sp. M125S2SP2A07QC]MCA6542786.1 hypothetical protein [Pseudanabaena sp. M074S1SP2A07QC]MCA6550222.1 hypothetical protein [Pseudanabaena sp. M152S2SP2A07QC]MCA6569568.1 hypothetical protein [Pseudanabaena sp. M065S1SP2A07QC]
MSYLSLTLLYIQLGVVANNPDEQEARTAYMDSLKDPYKGLASFSREYHSV